MVTPLPKWTHLDSATATVLHQVADVSWLNRCSNECVDIVMVQLLQLQTHTHTHITIRHSSRNDLLVKKLNISPFLPTPVKFDAL